MAQEVLTNSLSRTDSNLPGGGAGSSTLHQTTSNTSSQQSPFDDPNNNINPSHHQNQYLQPGQPIQSTRRPSLGVPLHSGMNTGGTQSSGNVDFTIPSNRNSFTEINTRRSRPNSGQFDSLITTAGGSYSSTSMGRTGSSDNLPPPRRPSNTGLGKPLWDPRRDSMDSVKFAAALKEQSSNIGSGGLSSATGQAGSGGIRLIQQNTGGSGTEGGGNTPNLNAFNHSQNQKRMSGNEDRFRDADSPSLGNVDLDRMEVSTGYGSDSGTAMGGNPNVRNTVGWAK